MHIAIVGTGLAGLAVGWHLLQLGLRVTFFDEKKIGQGASGVATGLVHPYVGEKARRSWRASEGLSHTEELIASSEKMLGCSVCVQRGLVRIALDDEQRCSLTSAREMYGDVEQIGGSEFLLRAGITIDVPAYLEGLFGACQKLGAEYVRQKVSLNQPVPEFDRTIFACGSQFLTSSFARELPLRAMKGQVLTLSCSQPIERSRIAKGYLAATFQPHLACLGATYEKQFSDEQVCLSTAMGELLPRTGVLVPPSCTWQVIGCRAGVRLMRQGSYIPFVEQLNEQCWWIGALGSRGLLYHAYLGRKLAEALLTDRSMLLPEEVQRLRR
jgi:glycine/D-amino acid oxidase-like deaminating enzyme